LSLGLVQRNGEIITLKYITSFALVTSPFTCLLITTSLSKFTWELNKFKADCQQKYAIIKSQLPENKFDYVNSEKRQTLQVEMGQFNHGTVSSPIHQLDSANANTFQI